MKRIRALTFSMLLLTALFPTVFVFAESESASPSKGGNAKFTDREIKENIRKYMAVLLGEREPTLQDYYDFEGENTQEEDEMLFEIDHCECKGWSPALHSTDCLRFMKQRALNATEVPSFYYRFLREILGPGKKKLRIHKIIRVNQGNNEYQLVIVEASLAKYSLEFYHAGGTNAVAPLGLVRLSKINGENVLDMVEKRKKGCD